MFSKIVFIQFGKFKSVEYAQLFNTYFDRLKHYTKPEIKEIKVSNDTPEHFEKIKDKIEEATKGTLMVFSERGKNVSSLELAKFLENGSGTLNIVVGSSWGMPEYLEKKANLLVSFGRLTLPHEAVRFLSSEQIYRAMTIIRGESYHK